MQTILYLHGFHSSPNSEKAVEFKRQVEQRQLGINVIAPQIPVLPEDAIQLIDKLVQHTPNLIGVVGSSLGGYLATYLHNKYDLPIVVINPAVTPFNVLDEYLGEQIHPITGEEYELTREHMNRLKLIFQAELNLPEQIWLLQQEKDEVLNYRDAMDKYSHCKVTFEQGGSHAFDGFERYPLAIADFLITAKDKS